ncbi:MAG TPA: TRAP transporter substrate-binding protein [Geminicoccaceae bacterium]|nr:TRAP transporter substrate-binding protein [Geminicoccaceae bacterium]
MIWRPGTGLTTAGAALATALAFATAAHTQERVQWKMQSAFPGNLPHTGVAAKRLEAMVERLSGGSFELKFYEPGALVPALECFDAAAKGSVESCYSPAAFHTGKYPALAFFSTVPFGPQYGEFFAWKIYGGGNELQKGIYDRHGLTKFDCGATGPETSGWFRQKVGSLAELKGIKMRFLGLGAQVMQKLGVSTQLLAPPDIYPALERGVIDATEFAMPDMDISLGFYQVAKYNYYPGWHQPASVGELLMNKAAFEALPKAYQAMLEAACGWNIHVTYAESEAMNPPAMKEMMEKYGVQNVRWSDEELAAFEQAWNEVLAEQSAADPTFKKVAESYLAFRKVYKTWGEAQALKSTYLGK